MKKLLFFLFFLPLSILAQTSYTINAGMMYYSPSILNINLGDTVFWINDGGNHNVNFDINTLTGLSFNNPESFVSTPTNSTEIYSHVFTISGTYNYDCSVYGHAASGMTGTIIVNGVNSIYGQSSKPSQTEVFEILGFYSNKLFNRIKIYRYSDGTVEKKIILD